MVARGKKDTFFTSNPKISYFHSVYIKQPASTQEIRLTQARNKPDWGKYTDFEIEAVGDIVKNFVLLIDLPSWLPLAQARNNPTSITTDLSGVEYGYCQDIGYHLIEKIQVFNDQIKLHEFWGQWLSWRRGQQANSSIYNASAGRHNPGPNTIGQAATPGRLRINIPVIGSQNPDDMGFPMTALSGQRFRMRVYLKKLESLVEASDGRLNPQPWAQTFQQQTQKDKPAIQFQTLPRYQIGSPILTLETTQVYIPRDSQAYLSKTLLNVPFQEVQQCVFTIEDPRWLPVVNTGATVSVPLLLDLFGSTSQLTVGVQTEASIYAGQHYQLSPPPNGTPSFLRDLRLNMGTLDRINQWSSTILRDVVNYYKVYKENRDPFDNVSNLYSLTFGPKEQFRPLGTFNLSRTLQATLYVDLNAITADSRNNSRKSFITVYGESWNIFEIKDGKGKVLFAD